MCVNLSFIIIIQAYFRGTFTDLTQSIHFIFFQIEKFVLLKADSQQIIVDSLVGDIIIHNILWNN